MDQLDYLVNQFGDVNEIIDESLLEDILEEIETMKELSYDLALAAIELGKPQILEYLLDANEFSHNEIEDFKDHVEEYVVSEEKQGTDPESIEEITETFEKLINNAENPRKKNWRIRKD